MRHRVTLVSKSDGEDFKETYTSNLNTWLTAFYGSTKAVYMSSYWSIETISRVYVDEREPWSNGVSPLSPWHLPPLRQP